MSIFPSRSPGSELLDACRRGSSPYVVARGPIGGQPLPLQLRAEARGAHTYHGTTPDCRLVLVCCLLGCPFHLCMGYQSASTVSPHFFLRCRSHARHTFDLGLDTWLRASASMYLPICLLLRQSRASLRDQYVYSSKNSDDNTRRYPAQICPL